MKFYLLGILSLMISSNGERLGELKMKIVQLPDKDQMFEISKEMEKEREEDWNKNVVSIVYQFTKI